MPTHDIIDNRNEKLADHIKHILSSRVAHTSRRFLSGCMRPRNDIMFGRLS
jgi:hypothetical protein